jgi:hypothetical protein
LVEDLVSPFFLNIFLNAAEQEGGARGFCSPALLLCVRPRIIDNLESLLQGDFRVFLSELGEMHALFI